MDQSKSFLKAVVWAYTGNWGDRAFSALFVFILAAILGPREFGLVSVGLIYIAFLQMFLDQGYLAALVQKKDLEAEHLDAVFWLYIVLSVVLIAVSIEMAGWWAAKNHAPESAPLIAVLSFCIPIEALARVQSAILYRNMEFKLLSIRTNMAVLVGGVVGIAMAFARFGGWALVGQQVAKDLVGLMLLWKLSKWRPRFEFSWRHLKELTAFSVSNFIAGLAVFADSQASSVFIGLFFGPVAIGLYRLADRLVNSAVSIATTSIQSVSLPEFARLQDQPDELRSSALACVRLSADVTLPALSILAVVSGELMATIGPKWTPASHALPLLCAVGMCSVFAYFTGPLLQALAKTTILAIVEWVRLVVGSILLIVVGFIIKGSPVVQQIEGIAGARFATMAFLVTPAFVYILMRLCKIRLRELVEAVAPSVLASLSAIVTVFLVKNIHWNATERPVFYLLTDIAFGAAAGVGVLLYLEVQLRVELTKALHRFTERASSRQVLESARSVLPPSLATGGQDNKEERPALGSEPLVSVVVPTFDRAYILRDALESVLAQTYPKFELIVVDDGSRDNTGELVASLSDERIRYIRHAQNRGCSAAYNTGIAAARGQLVAFLDSDDLWRPEYLERQVGLVLRHAAVDAVFCDTEIWGKFAAPSLVRLMYVFPKLLNSNGGAGEYVFTGRQMFLCLLDEVPIKPSAFIVKREMFLKAGVFDENWPSGTDWDLFLRLSRLATFGYRYESLVIQRRTSDATYSKYRVQDKVFLLNVFIKLKRELLNDPEALQAVRRGIADHCSNLARLYLESGRLAMSVRVYMCGIKEARSPRMLAGAVAALLPAKARMLVKRTLVKHSSAERALDLRSRFWRSLSTIPEADLEDAKVSVVGIPSNGGSAPSSALSPAPVPDRLSAGPGRQLICPVCGRMEGTQFLATSDRFYGRPEIYQLMRCTQCTLVWLADPPEPAEMGRHYGDDYDRTIAAAGDDPGRWEERASTLWQHKPGGAVLDIGCSSGGFLASLKGPTWRRFGIEMSESMAEQAHTASGAQVFLGDILSAPFPPASFDAITCFHVLEHLYEPVKVLTKIREWLKPNGIFYMMVPNIDSAGARIFGPYWSALELPRHLLHFSPTSVRHLAQRVGLQEVFLATHRELFFEKSVRYILDGVFGRLGIERTPAARAKPPNLAWKIIRKAFRLTLLPVITLLASRAGDGESIHAIFAKTSIHPR